jgi:hypothetical protein
MPRTVVYLCPGARCDVVPYTFYRHAHPDVLLDVRHVDVAGYDPRQGDDLLQLAGRGLALDAANVDAVVVGGSAFSFGFTWDELLLRAEQASDQAGVPVMTDMMVVVAQMRSAGASRVTVAHRLAGVADDSVRRFFVSAGFDCAGVVASPQAMTANLTDSLTAGAADAERLAADAVALDATSDSIVLLGGTWWVGPAHSLVASAGRRFFNNVLGIAEHFAGSTKQGAPAPITGQLRARRAAPTDADPEDVPGRGTARSGGDQW